MHDYSAEDRATRERLERNSSAGARADVCGILNKVAAGDVVRELPGAAALLLLTLEEMTRRSASLAKSSRYW
jgi:hypothetical protein